MPITLSQFENSPSEVKSKIFISEVLSVTLEFDQYLSPMRSIIKSFDFFKHISERDGRNLFWYKTKINTDLYQESKTEKFSLPHKHIRTNNPQLFMFRNKKYTHIDIIFGQKKTYWKFTDSTENGYEEVHEGETILNIGTCSCCIDKDYRKIIESLKRNCENRSLKSSKNYH